MPTSRPQLSLLRLLRIAAGNKTIAQAAADAQVNEFTFGKIERLQEFPSRRVAEYLASVHRTPIEKLLSPIKL